MSASRPRTVPSEAQHTKLLQDLEGQQVSLGKATNETQDTLRDKEAQVVKMRSEERELEVREEAEDHDLDSSA
jgi:kinetochore protein Spc24